MSRFIGHLEVRIPDDDRERELIVDFLFLSDIAGLIEVPAGFKTDYASVPRILWSILPPTGKYTKASVIHDYLYRSHRVSREEADAIFLEAMEDLGVNPIIKYAMWLGVRIGGWFPWRKYGPKA
jgi:hypothetical protein